MTSRTPALVAVVLAAVAVVAVSFGVRQSFGLFMRPMTLDLGWGRETLSLVFAVQALLNGLAAPFAGAVSDRWGAGWTVLGGALAYGAGLALMALATTPATMLLSGGLLVGMGISACGMPVLMSAVGKVAPQERRSLWMGLVAAGGTGGQLLVIPLTQHVIAAHGWASALTTLAVALLVVAPLGLVLLAVRRSDAAAPAAGPGSLLEALAEARRHSGFALLNAGFFVCGFQVQFVATHLPAFIEDQGLGAGLAARALVIIALCNMVGAALAGYLGGKRRKKYLLSGIYLARAVLIAAFVTVPVSAGSVMLFAAVMGFIWLGTVPLTSGLVAQVFGTRYMTTLFAIVYLSHQAGNFAGAWIGGRVFDATGSYELVWWTAAALGVLAAVLHAPMDDRPLRRAAAPA